jgi:hypothetical protein
MPESGRRRFTGDMLHRVAATFLWAYFGWYVTAYLLSLLGAPANFAILGGLAMAGLAWVDIRGGRRAAAPGGAAVPTAPAER